MERYRGALRRSGRHKTHCTANCAVCGWQEDDWITAARAGTEHVRTTGHPVNIERATIQTISVPSTKGPPR